VIAMSRPQKMTVDYFPHDTNAHNSRTLFVLESKFGNDGYAFWFKLLEILGSSEGHSYCLQKPSYCEYFYAIMKVDQEKGREILETLANLDSIDPDLLHHNIIYCQKLVDRVSDVYTRRGGKEPTKPIIEDNNDISDNNNPIKVNNNPLNKTKTNHIIVNKITYSKESLDLSNLLKELILKNNPVAKIPPNGKWAYDIDKIIRLDSRTPEEIEQVI
jgi:hypothetical protein